MKFEFKKIPSLPRLAWCAHITKSTDTVQVIHGPWVETQEKFFFEGAWAGDFASGDFEASTSCVGSGAAIGDKAVTFASPSQSKERLHLIQFENEIIVSNSFVFLLRQAEEELDPNYLFYMSDFMSCSLGVNRLVDRIKTNSERYIQLYYCCNVIIDANLKIRTQSKPLPGAFSSYEHYMEFVRNETKAIAENANHEDRDFVYKPLSTVSSGYDSPACSVLAKEVGCTEALTFTHAREQFAQGDDSGREIAEILGLEVHSFDRKEYLSRNDFPEAEFLSCGTGGEDVILATFDKYLPQTLFFTGFGGDSTWAKYHSNPLIGTEYTSYGLGGSSLSEFRLRVGFIHYPLPLFTLTELPSIHKISNSEEMKAWCVGGGTRYERPVARRMVEECGVPRHLFGLKKQAVSQPYYHSTSLEEILTKSSYSDFKKFVNANGYKLSNKDSILYNVGPLYYKLIYFLARVKVRIAKEFGIYKSLPYFFPERYYQPFSENVFTFHWSVSHLLSRYDTDE